MTGDPQGNVGSHYFDGSPATPSQQLAVSLVLPDLTTDLVSDRGVFSGTRIDPGTKILLQEGPPLESPTGLLVDVGCGYGPIARTLIHRAPTATVIGVDVNERAVALTNTNLADFPSASAVLLDEFDPSLAVDEVWSNPPIRVGKPALHELLTLWHDRLKSGGRMVLVVQKHLGSDSLQRWMQAEGWPATRLFTRASYRILEVRK